MKITMPQKTLFVLPVIGILALAIVWNTSGRGSILQHLEPNWHKLHGYHSGRQIGSASGVPASLNRTSNYREQLRNAYSTQHEDCVNTHNFNLILDEPMACRESDNQTLKRVLLLVLVISLHGKVRARQTIRQTWASPKEFSGQAVVTLFLLAKHSKMNQHELKRESEEYHDLIMEDFEESYNNLTLKTIMAMKWASTHCSQASFVMKTDDDMYVSYNNLLNYAAVAKLPSTDLGFGLVLKGEAPIRDQRSKWYMPVDLYPGKVYPPWLSGGGFVLTGDVPRKIYAASLDIKYLHLEDVYIGVCLEKLKIKPVMNKQFNNMHIPYSYCRYRDIITSHHFDFIALGIMWEDQLLDKPCWFWT